LDHVTIRVSDREASERFYSTVLPMIGLEQTHSGDDYAEWDQFSLTAASEDRPATERLHVGFFASSPEVVDAFWRTGTEAGYRDDGAPGSRPQYRPDYYGGFLLDPDENSVEAVHHGLERAPGTIDHLWIRVADVDAARAFYETVAPYTGFDLRMTSDQPRRSAFAGPGASFSLVEDGPPTQHAHVAFAAETDAVVDAFHRAATQAGYRDNGVPGERPRYHAGYYGAYVLDADGNNIEVVHHNRPT
jgi:catechol 2,3-dioxygenase-like lactoylglutathione lyase family enzyme